GDSLDSLHNSRQLTNAGHLVQREFSFPSCMAKYHNRAQNDGKKRRTVDKISGEHPFSERVVLGWADEIDQRGKYEHVRVRKAVHDNGSANNRLKSFGKLRKQVFRMVDGNIADQNNNDRYKHDKQK